MTQYRVYLIAVSIGLLTAGFGVRAYAMRGEIKKPSGIALFSDYPHAARLEVERALADSGAEFVRGHFINWISMLYFRGDVSKLNTMVGRLSKCERTTIAIKLDELDADYDWSIVHDAHSNRFQFIVNLRSANISVKELSIPDIHSTKVER